MYFAFLELKHKNENLFTITKEQQAIRLKKLEAEFSKKLAEEEIKRKRNEIERY